MRNYAKKVFVFVGGLLCVILFLMTLFVVIKNERLAKPPVATKGYLEDKRVMQAELKAASKELTPKAIKGLHGLYAKNLDARQDLRQAADSVPLNFAVKTVLVEHTGKAGIGEVNSLLEKLADKPKRLATVKSKAKASGPLQFMPKTYKAMAARHPGAKLEKDFAKGTADTKNAMMAANLLVHEDSKCLSIKKIGQKEVEALGAAYNGGCKRGKMQLFGKTAKMPKETQGYVKKHKRVGKLLNT